MIELVNNEGGNRGTERRYSQGGVLHGEEREKQSTYSWRDAKEREQGNEERSLV